MLREKVIELIHKLRRMADKKGGASENEMSQSLEAIRRLKTKHDIQEHELKDPDEYVLGKPFPIIGGEEHLWEAWLSSIPAYLCDCAPVTVPHPILGDPMALLFRGTPLDVECADKMFEALIENILKGAEDHCGPGWSLLHASYAMGVVAVLGKRAEDIVKHQEEAIDSASGAIVLKRRDRVLEDTLNMDGVTKKKPDAPKNISGEHYVKGMIDGHATRLREEISSER